MFYFIGGGFVVIEVELIVGKVMDEGDFVFYFFKFVVEMLQMVECFGKFIVDMKCSNEILCGGVDNFLKGCVCIWQVMNDCIDCGFIYDGIFSGGFNVCCCVKLIYDVLMVECGMNFIVFYIINDWMSVYVMVVNEENVVGGQVVIVFMNGVVGVLFFVICYWFDYVSGVM